MAWDLWPKRFREHKSAKPKSPTIFNTSGTFDGCAPLNEAQRAQKDLQHLILKAGSSLDEALVGLHPSQRRGTAQGFKEHKAYMPGDDLRHLDWHALARRERMYIKVFENEAKMGVELLVDTSGSMGYGTKAHPRKATAAIILSLALTLWVARQRDQIGLMTLDAACHRRVARRSATTQLHAIGHILNTIPWHGEADLGQALRLAACALPKQKRVVIISDMLPNSKEAFLDDDGDETAFLAHFDDIFVGLRQLLARGHRVSVLHLIHPDEVNLPFNQPTNFVSCNNDGQDEIRTLPQAVRCLYQKRWHTVWTTLSKRAQALNIGWIQARSDQPAAQALRQLLMQPGTH